MELGYFRRLALVAGLLFLMSARSGAASYYNFQQYYGQGQAGAIGSATLQFSNNASIVRANLIKGIGTFVYNLVIFVDTTPGGFTSTAPFSDRADGRESSISGYNTSRSVATFAPGFEADYAIVVGVNYGSGVYKMVNDASGPHLELVNGNLNFLYADSPNHASYSFQFNWADLGLPNQNTNFFKFESSYITGNGYRWVQSFEGITGQEGYSFVTFTNYDTYGVPPVPENTNAALAVFGGLALIIGIAGKARRCLRRVCQAGSPQS